MSFTIGADVGGTFTDVVCSNGNGTWRAKAPTDPDQFARGVMQACEKVAEQLGIPLADLLSSVQRFGLGTTAVTNVLATGRGLNVGLLTTAGFESHLHMAKGYRVECDGWLEPPWMPLDGVSALWLAGCDPNLHPRHHPALRLPPRDRRRS